MVQCSGAPVSLSSAVQAVRPAGIIVQVAILPNQEIPVNLAALVAKEVQLRGTQRFDTEIDEAIELLAQDARFDAVVTQVVPVAEAETAFATAKDASAPRRSCSSSDPPGPARPIQESRHVRPRPPSLARAHRRRPPDRRDPRGARTSTPRCSRPSPAPGSARSS